MKITSGLFEHMVLQRDGRDVSSGAIMGEATGNGAVVARVRREAKVLAGFAAKKIGMAKAGKFTAKLAGVPVGGPYTIELSIAGGKGSAAERVTVGDVLVGDVWVLGGQSNMQGYGLLATRAKGQGTTRAFYMNDVWGVAEDPIHNMWACIDEVHVKLGVVRGPANTVAGTGPGVAFGQEMQRLTGVPQGLLACAHGGTTMEQWDPAKKVEGGSGSLYGAMLRRFEKNGGAVAGVLWYQGESDTGAESAEKYTERMQGLVGSMRKDLGNAKLPFALVQISRVTGWGENPMWNVIREKQRTLGETVPHVVVVPAMDLTMDDLIHISGHDQNRLGRRMAEAVHTERRGKRALPPPMEVERIEVIRNAVRGYGEVHVKFRNVVGALQADGLRANGFSVVGMDGYNKAYVTELRGETAVLHTSLSPAEGETCRVFYGAGNDAFCNVTDGADRSVPAFGPLRFNSGRVLTGFASTVEVSELQASAGKLEGLGYPAEQGGLGFARRKVVDCFAHVHEELAKRAPEDVLVWFRFRVECAEAMELAVLLGYDGPVKVFIDGREVLHDANGVNPAIADSQKVVWSARAGGHEILAALGSNDGRAWGVFLRFERLDVNKVSKQESKKILKEGAGKAVAMPVWVE